MLLSKFQRSPFVLGEELQVAFIQPGSATLWSLRANLVCLEQHITTTSNLANDSGISRQVREVIRAYA